MTNILIVEDEQNLARFIELELTHENYTVDIENDGRWVWIKHYLSPMIYIY